MGQVGWCSGKVNKWQKSAGSVGSNFREEGAEIQAPEIQAPSQLGQESESAICSHLPKKEVAEWGQEPMALFRSLSVWWAPMAWSMPYNKGLLGHRQTLPPKSPS